MIRLLLKFRIVYTSTEISHRRRPQKKVCVISELFLSSLIRFKTTLFLTSGQQSKNKLSSHPTYSPNVHLEFVALNFKLPRISPKLLMDDPSSICQEDSVSLFLVLISSGRRLMSRAIINRHFHTFETG